MSEANARDPGAPADKPDPRYEAGYRDAFRVAITLLRMEANPEEFPPPSTPIQTEPQGAAETDAERAFRHRQQMCIDACAGVPTEALESGALGRLLDLAAWPYEGDHGSRCEEHEDGCFDCEMVAALVAIGRLK